MRRLVWLLLAAFCTAIAQVQPADVPPAKENRCGCCADEADACGMPDCGLPPIVATSGLVLQSPASTSRATAKRTFPAPSTGLINFQVQFFPRVLPAEKLGRRVATPSASVPLFQAHCSYLI